MHFRKSMGLWLTICVMVLSVPCGAWAETAVDAFLSLISSQEQQDYTAKSSDEYLNDVVSGKYALIPTMTEELTVFAADLEPLSEITIRDIAAYASLHDQKMAQVRNAYYKALANTLKAEIQVHPASEQKYRNIQEILSLFLDLSDQPENDAAKAAIRAQMSPAYSQMIASEYRLPTAFVEFLMMNTQWNDTDWSNDLDWQTEAAWLTGQGESSAEINVGARDSLDQTDIADMQEMMISLGYLKGKADGVFGPRTQRALLEYQSANGLKATGVYDSLTRQHLIQGDSVARWDYSKDLWDTDDLDPDTPDHNTPDDNTPDTPDKNTPDTPDKNTPDTPDKNTPDTPDKNTPDTPDKNTPDTPDKNTPDTPDTPEQKMTKKTTTTKKPSTTQKKDSPDTPEQKTTKKPSTTQKKDSPDTPEQSRVKTNSPDTDD